MIKPASSLCNLSCEYCFYRDVSEHREHLHFDMTSKDLAATVIEKALNYADGESVAFAFQGGEPTLAGLDFFEYFVSTARELNRKSSKIFYSIQTNGLLIDKAWAEFFAANGFLVGLSLDGDLERNKFRKRPSGTNAYFSIDKAAQCLTRYGADFNILTVLTGFCADNCEKIYRYFRSKGYRYLQFIPCLRPFGDSTKSELYMTASQYSDFLIRTFNLYVKDYVRGDYMSIRQFDNWVGLYLGRHCEQCGMLGHCTHQFVAESNGNIYPCDFYCTDEYLLGNIKDFTFAELEKCDTASEFIKESLAIKDECRTCRFFALCRGGGCKRTKQSEDYCEAYKAFFSACLPLFRVFAVGEANTQK